VCRALCQSCPPTLKPVPSICPVASACHQTVNFADQCDSPQTHMAPCISLATKLHPPAWSSTIPLPPDLAIPIIASGACAAPAFIRCSPYPAARRAASTTPAIQLSPVPLVRCPPVSASLSAASCSIRLRTRSNCHVASFGRLTPRTPLWYAYAPRRDPSSGRPWRPLPSDPQRYGRGRDRPI
jgi:hypothetical protein